MPGHADPREALIRRALQLQRVSNSISADRNAVLEALFNEVAGLIAKLDPTGPPQPAYRRVRVAKLLQRVEELTGEAFGTWHTGVRSDLARLGRAHGQAITSDLVATLGPLGSTIKAAAPTQNMVKAILDTNPFQGETLSGWADVQEQATIRRIRQQVQIGMVEEESIDQMVRRIRGRSVGRGRYAGGVMQTTTREATGIVRTAVTEVAAEARLETFSQNPNVTQSYQYVATLDDRTTEICMSLDGNIYPYGEGNPTPPQHFNCRSTIIPVVDWEGLGLEPPEEGMRAARDPVTGKRTQVPRSTTYADWLRDQPASVQDDILGRGKARLFRNGEISLSDLVRRDNSIVTLAELDDAA